LLGTQVDNTSNEKGAPSNGDPHGNPNLDGPLANLSPAPAERSGVYNTRRTERKERALRKKKTTEGGEIGEWY